MTTASSPAPIIRARGLTKSYPLHQGLGSHLKAFAFGVAPAHHTALADVSFDIAPGDSVGILGFNGSGKSTLLRLVAGIAKPTRGEISVSGRVTAVFGLGTLFDSELTGRENARREAALYGVEDVKEQAIADFAELGEAFDRPLRTYSSGMRARLGLAVVLQLDFEVLLLDEVLAVGDDYFREKAHEALADLSRRGRVLVIVTHSPYDVIRLCNRALWLDRGRLLREGSPRDVALDYLREAHFDTYAAHAKTLSGVVTEGPRHELMTADHVYGSGEARILGVSLTSLDGGAPRAGSPARITIRYRATQLVKGVACYVGFMDSQVQRIFAAVSLADTAPFDLEPGEGTLEAELAVLPVAPGSYTMNTGLYDAEDGPDSLRYYDHDTLLFRKGTTIEVLPPLHEQPGSPSVLLRVPHVWR